MSLAEQQATYYRDPDTGFLMMPGTRRPDGTWRKPRRIKEGYVPQDEVPLYEPKGKQFAREKSTGTGIPGLNPGVSGLSKGILNMKIDTFDSRAAIAEGIASGAAIPGLDPDLVKPMHQHHNCGAGSGSQKSGSKKKHKSKSNSSSSQCNTSITNSYTSSSAVNASDSAAAAEAAAAAAATDPAKKLRNLKKKLRDIEALESKLEQGIIANPEPEQLEKVSRKSQVEEEIDELERQLDL